MRQPNFISIDRKGVESCFGSVISMMAELHTAKLVEDHLERYSRSMDNIASMLKLYEERGGGFALATKSAVQSCASVVRVIGQEDCKQLEVFHPLYGDRYLIWTAREEDLIAMKLAAS